MKLLKFGSNNKITGRSQRPGKLRGNKGAQYLIQSNISIKYCVPGTCDVTFDYKDYRDDKDKQMRLGGLEFLRRFLMHVLPQGFVRIRHYGFLSNRHRTLFLPRLG